MNALQIALVQTLVIIAGIVINDWQLRKLQAHIDQIFDELRDEWQAETARFCHNYGQR